ncbi:hypothetical protein SNE40_015041 [Patella caerulea]|uniref:TIR domain-containing protein n=1 Tax=Patella caerulea TaxID=87958 RepID=A0AAN8JK71_PATCE
MGGKILTSILLLVLSVVVKQDYGSFVVSSENCRCSYISRCESCCYFDFESLKQLIIDEACSISSSGLIKSPTTSEENFNFYIQHTYSCLSAVPTNICDFPMIQSLVLSNNYIKHVPKLSCLKELVNLDLTYNMITVLKTGIFDSLDKLQRILLSNNFIKTIELGVLHTGLHSIKYVRLDHNNLTESDVWVLNITHAFCIFDVSHNQISKVTNKNNLRLKWSKNYKYGPGLLDFSNNKLRVLDWHVLADLASSLHSFLIQFIFWGFDFRNNPWHCDCHFYSFLYYFDNINKRFSLDYLNVTCHSPPHLNGQTVFDIDLSEFVCNITDSCPSKCFCQKQPDNHRMIIDCRNAGLSAMPLKLPFHKSLYLYFQNNFIQDIPNLPYIERTSYFDISNNTLNTISLVFTQGSSLGYLNMSNNNLESLPESIQKLRGTNIDISNNSLVCNCSNLWLGEWFRSKPNIKYRSLLTCSVSGNQNKIKIQEFQKEEHDCEVSNSTVISIVLVIFGVLLIVLTICFINFRYELLTLYYIFIKSKLRRIRKIQNESKAYDICVLLNETNDSDRLWVKDHLIHYFEENALKSYIPYRDGVIGEVTSDAIITNMNNSSTVLAVVSSSFFADPLNIFNLEAAYHQKIRNRNGKLIFIKLGQDCFPFGSNGYIRAMFRLKLFIHADNPKLMSKLTSQIQLPPKYKSRSISVTSEDILWF